MKTYFKTLVSKWERKRQEDLFFSQTLCEITKPKNCAEVKITVWETFRNLFRKKPLTIFEPCFEFEEEITPERLRENKLLKKYGYSNPESLSEYVRSEQLRRIETSKKAEKLMQIELNKIAASMFLKELKEREAHG